MNFKQLFENYVDTNSRIHTKMAILASKICISSKPKEMITHYVDFPCSPFSMFKILMLIHYCYVENLLDVEVIHDILNCIHSKSSVSTFQNMVDQKVNMPYKLYLQKCTASSSQGLTGQQKIYQAINILFRGTSFCDILYTFGRYYKNKYQYSLDFNILLGRDLERKYRKLRKMLPRHPQQYITNQLESIHEKMYIIYYNCYYFRELKRYVPRWINTDHKKQNQTPSKIKQNKSFASTMSNSPNENFHLEDSDKKNNNKMTQSVLLMQTSFKDKNMSQLQLTRVSLMKSMQRVLQQMEDY